MWEIEYCAYRDLALANYLLEGWEPFAVTRENGEDIIWLKRQVAVPN